ncbi:MAG: phosphotransferase [Acidimicrobiales bacterium]
MTNADHDQAPFAAGVHLLWPEVPAHVRGWVEASTGARIIGVKERSGGFSPGCCSVLALESGRSVFVKAVSVAQNPVSPRIHRREARAAADLPRSAQLPVLLDSYDDGDWVALVFEEIVGPMPKNPWSDTELEAVLEGLASLHEALTPCPIADLEATSIRMGAALSGWRSLAQSDPLPSGVDPWVRRHIERLAEMEADSRVAVDDGATMVHCDVRADNVLLAPGGPVFVDWPHAGRGAAVFDVVAWAPSVALEKGPDPETLFGMYRLRGWSDAEQITAMVSGIAGYFAYHETLPAPPGLPTLRRFQAAQGAITLAWLRERTRWR